MNIKKPSSTKRFQVHILCVAKWLCVKWITSEGQDRQKAAREKVEFVLQSRTSKSVPRKNERLCRYKVPENERLYGHAVDLLILVKGKCLINSNSNIQFNSERSLILINNHNHTNKFRIRNNISQLPMQKQVNTNSGLLKKYLKYFYWVSPTLCVNMKMVPKYLPFQIQIPVFSLPSWSDDKVTRVFIVKLLNSFWCILQSNIDKRGRTMSRTERFPAVMI